MSNIAEREEAGLPLLSFEEIAKGDFAGKIAPGRAEAFRVLQQWTRSFLMSAHPELGRTGDVCPFTAQGARVGTLRFGVSEASGRDISRIREEMRGAFEAFEAIAHPRGMGNFRAVIVGFPNCRDEEGLAALAAVQKSMRRLSFRRGRMIGVFHDQTSAPGLWNPEFRPLRSPIPLIAIRALVENDAVFVARHPLLAPTYLRRFRLSGGKRLFSHLLRRA
ncbi:MAG: DUF6875 domain-containing protein [Hyphomicrobiales bacterium]